MYSCIYIWERQGSKTVQVPLWTNLTNSKNQDDSAVAGLLISKWLVRTHHVAVICSDTGHCFTFILYLEVTVTTRKIPSFAQSEIFNVPVFCSLVFAVS